VNVIARADFWMDRQGTKRERQVVEAWGRAGAWNGVTFGGIPRFSVGPAAILSVGGLAAYVSRSALEPADMLEESLAGGSVSFADGVRNKILNGSDIQPWLDCYFLVALMTNKEHDF
jgi:hypothetical protein